MSSAQRSNWFQSGGQDYARYRPLYPPQLAHYLAQVAPDADCAVDVGCGSGQLTTLLADHFHTVIGVDPSAAQLASAIADPRVQYLVAPAEALPLADARASLVCAAQAAHWFNLPAFHAQVRRIAQPGAVVALISYGVMVIDGPADAVFQHFYQHGVGPWWPAERALVDQGYAGLDFPYAEFGAPAMRIQAQWSLADVLGYVGTWSAVRRAREAGQDALLEHFADRLTGVWGEPAQSRAVHWPINMRIGRV